MEDNAFHRPTSRVLDILELLANSPKGLTLTEIAIGIDAPKSSILTFIKTLARRKYISFDNSSMTYSIGIGLYCVGQSYLKNNRFEIIKESMANIVNEVNEICQMGIIDNADVLYIAKVDSNDPISIVSSVGKRIPAYATAIGKALLSNHTKAQLLDLYGTNLKPFTVNTIKTCDELYEQLQLVKKNGYAYENQESNANIECIAVPLYKDDKIIAAISISIPTFRSNKSKKNNIIKVLQAQAPKMQLYIQDLKLDATVGI